MARPIILDSKVTSAELKEIKKKYGSRRILSVWKDATEKVHVKLAGRKGR